MKDYTGFERAFMRMDKAWYSQGTMRIPEPPTIMIGMYQLDEGTLGEFSVQWEDLGEPHLSPRLKVFIGSWEVLWLHFKDLLAKMAELDNAILTEEEFAKLLIELGIKDFTEYERKIKSRE
jgi:hypothetical protein